MPRGNARGEVHAHKVAWIDSGRPAEDATILALERGDPGRPTQ
jgi:hypothetical protein